jgi:MoxR-like ATPase
MKSAAAVPTRMSLEEVYTNIKAIEGEVRKRVVGIDDGIKCTLIAMFAKGHILVEGVPGLAKTLLFKTFAEAVDVRFRRISFAADLLPKDVIGIEHFDPATRQLELVVKGPLHTNILLADELNRARTSSKGSVLEPMEEGQVTTELGGTYKLSSFFMVVATQNPVEEEGTFGLGRAEKDRFLMMVPIGYSSPSDEEEIIRRYGVAGSTPSIAAVTNETEILAARDAVRSLVHVEPAIVTKIQQMIDQTRPERTSLNIVKQLVELGGGASPRAGINIVQAARVHAVMSGDDFVSPSDIAAVIPPILRHRLVFRPAEVEEGEVEARVNEIIGQIVQMVF